ncbi:MAG: DevR family CRISPR-associated autoregulator [candidate division WOR-3 bacterium]
MIKFVTFAVKTQLNVHDLNNEAVAGNVQDIRIMECLDEQGTRREAPAVSGRMLKHWHYEAMRRLILNGGYSGLPLCAGCRAGEPIRPGEKNGEDLQQMQLKEKEAITNCSICDIHGYLIAQDGAKKRGKSGEDDGDEAGVSARRSSRVMFSWLMPVLEHETVARQVLHTRVSQQQKKSSKGENKDEDKDSAQMLFSKSYASGIYAFVSAFDAARVGVVEQELDSSSVGQKTDDLNVKKRISVAIEAYRYLISGQIGASLSHALPHMNLRELLVCYSKSGPLPFPVSPMYPDYIRKTCSLLPAGANLIYWGDGAPDGVVKVDSVDEVFRKLDELIRDTDK